MRSWPWQHNLYNQLSTSNATTIKPNKRQLVIVVLKWVLVATICGIITFFTLFGIDFNAQITLKDSFAPTRPDSGALSSTCFSNYSLSSNKRFGIIPSVPVNKDDVCYDYAALIVPQNISIEPTYYHTYWSTHMSKHLTQNQLASLRSFAATQPSHNTLFVWISLKDKERLLESDSLWHSIQAKNIQLKVVEDHSESLLKHTPLTSLEHGNLQDLLRLVSLHSYGGVWFNLDVLFVRDMTPLLQFEWLSQATCFERSKFASSSVVDSRFSGALMHFYAGSPYICEMLSVAYEELGGVVNGLQPLKSLNQELYARVFHRILRHKITPWEVLPWCFTDPTQCKSSNSLPNAFKNAKNFSREKLNAVFAYHWHEKWTSSPGSVFTYLDEKHKQLTLW